MADFILIDGDMVAFMPTFGQATVVVLPGTIAGTGPATIGGKSICVEGDEASVEVAGCMYITQLHTIPGTGTLKVDALADDQLAAKTSTGDKLVLLLGSKFSAVFEVASPAMQPPPGPGAPQPDSTTSYSGEGSFLNANTKFQGT
jgi:hypothetical protein